MRPAAKAGSGLRWWSASPPKPSRLLEGARRKLATKRLDLIAANAVGADRRPFGSDTVALTLIDRTGSKEALPEVTKEQAAHRLLDRVGALLGT